MNSIMCKLIFLSSFFFTFIHIEKLHRYLFQFDNFDVNCGKKIQSFFLGIEKRAKYHSKIGENWDKREWRISRGYIYASPSSEPEKSEKQRYLILSQRWSSTRDKTRDNIRGETRKEGGKNRHSSVIKLEWYGGRRRSSKGTRDFSEIKVEPATRWNPYLHLDTGRLWLIKEKGAYPKKAVTSSHEP